MAAMLLCACVMHAKKNKQAAHRDTMLLGGGEFPMPVHVSTPPLLTTPPDAPMPLTAIQVLLLQAMLLAASKA